MIHELPQGRIHEDDWLQADLEPGYSLAIVDGPYGMGKAGWDRMKVDQLSDWYAPHIARLSALCAKSATVYLWNTAEGWARLDPVMRAAGWTFCVLVTWEKTNPPSMKGCEALLAWPDVTEVCGMYRREAWDPHEAKRGLRWLGIHPGEIDKASGMGCMASRKWLGTDTQAQSPTSADLRKVVAELPVLRWPWTEPKPRPHFESPVGVSNVWQAPLVAGPERLVGSNGLPLHPCQKPLAFAERMIRASSRPGERVLVPFGGTCREAVICEWLARTDPKETRRYDVCELNQDGPDYIGAALAQIRGEDTRKANPAQVKLFGGTQ